MPAAIQWVQEGKTEGQVKVMRRRAVPCGASVFFFQLMLRCGRGREGKCLKVEDGGFCASLVKLVCCDDGALVSAAGHSSTIGSICYL